MACAPGACPTLPAPPACEPLARRDCIVSTAQKLTLTLTLTMTTDPDPDSRVCPFSSCCLAFSAPQP